MKRKHLVTAVTVILLVAVALPVGAQTIWTNFQNVRAKQIDVTGASTLRGVTTIPSGGSLVVASGATLTTNGYTTGDVTTLNVSGESKLTGATWITGTLNGAGDATLASINVTGNGDVTGNLEVVDHILTQSEFYMIPPDALAVTDGGTINPTGAVVELAAAGAVGADMAAAGDGEFVILINTANQTITITETATTHMAGDFSMGQWDTITFIGQGVIWNEVARSNN